MLHKTSVIVALLAATVTLAPVHANENPLKQVLNPNGSQSATDAAAVKKVSAPADVEDAAALPGVTHFKKGLEGAADEATAALAAATSEGVDGDFAKLINHEAAKNGIPAKLVRAVIEVESSFRPDVTGAAGEVGLMQIKPTTAKEMGFSGNTKDLYDPATNIKYGVKYLAGAHKRGGGTICGTILKYNAGHYAKSMNPISQRYCDKIKRIIGA